MEINVKTFYTVGMVCFGIIALAGLYTYYSNFDKIDTASKIGNGAGIFFNIIITLFFYTLLKQLNKQIETQEPVNIEEIIEEVKVNSRKTNKREKGLKAPS